MSRLAEILPRRIDLHILFFALALTAIGIAMVVSTTAGTPRADLAGKQIFFAVLGLTAAGVLLALDYRILLQYSPGLYGFTLLVLLLLPIFGKRIAGARSWIKVGGGFQVQPSEFARISIALLLAWILESDDRALLRSRTIAAIGAATGVPVVLVLLQPDLGLALTYLPFLAAALFFCGIPRRRLPGAAGPDRDRLRRHFRQGLETRHAEPPRLPSRQAHGLHLRGPRGGVGVRGRRGLPRALRLSHRARARARARRARSGRVDARPPPRPQHRRAGARERGDERRRHAHDGHHA